MVEVDGTIDVDINPKVNLFYNLETENKICCTVLPSKGYEGNQFKIHAPRVVNSKTLATIKSQTFERVKAISDSKAAGQMVHAIGG